MLRILFTTVFALATATAQARDSAQDEREILRVEAEVCRAFEAGDADTLRRHLEPTFTLVDSRGTVTDLAQNAAEVARREPVYEMFRNHDQRIRLYGDAAVVTGITSIRSRAADGEVFEGDFRFTDTWIHRDGTWKMTASHASRLPK